MKKLILSALLVVAISSAFAQTPKPITPAPAPIKKEFTPDYSKVVTIPVKIQLGILSQYFYSLQNPGFEAGDLQGKQIQAIKQGNAALIDSLYSGFNKKLMAQHDAWAADTLKQFNSKIKKP